MGRTTTADTVPAGEVSVADTSHPDQFIKYDTPQFVHIILALFSAGLATFALPYCVQSTLPVLSSEFDISPASNNISLSISTAMLAVGLLSIGLLSDAIGRKSVMVTALLLAACCSLLSAMVTGWHSTLIMRVLIGLSLDGVAAASMAYLSEEAHPSFVAFSMGLYISGNSTGGMSGHLLTGVFTGFFGWRVVLAVINGLVLVATIMSWCILPESYHFHSTSLRPENLLINLCPYWRNRGLPLLLVEGFLPIGALITLLNYISHRLMMPPRSLNQAVIGLLSVAYLTGTWSSPKAEAMTIRLNHGPVMLGFTAVMLYSLLLALFPSLWLIPIGMLLLSADFFVTYSVASSWISLHVRHARGQASSLYLLNYYLGSSLAKTLGGVLWRHYGQNGVGGLIALLLLAALLTGTCLHQRLKWSCVMWSADHGPPHAYNGRQVHQLSGGINE